jgi:hypothetical protein
MLRAATLGAMSAIAAAATSAAFGDHWIGRA